MRAWHSMSAEEVCRALETNPLSGLSAQEVQARRQIHGQNLVQEGKPPGATRIFVSQFADFMIIVLMVAAVLAGIVGDPEDTLAILAIVVLNAAIGFVQQYRAEHALAALKHLAGYQSRVLRDGESSIVPAADLVPGDIVFLQAGDATPADLRVVESAGLRIDESSLTGESQPADKHLHAISNGEQLPIGDRKNMAYRGTMVTYGRGRGFVVATGMQTELGRIAGLLAENRDARTPLQKRMTRFGKIVALAALVICALMFVAGVARGEPFVRMLLTSISLAVAAIPEALPAVLTISLALGASRMLRLRALVRRLPAVETLGSVTYVCSDKTGTLTQNKMKVEALYAAGTDGSPSTQSSSEEPWKTLFSAMALCNDAAISVDGEVLGDPTEAALLLAARDQGFDKAPLDRAFPRIFEHAFDSERRRMSTIHDADGGRIALVKGSPESVLERCDAVWDGAVLCQTVWQELAGQMASRGLRVLAIACRRLPAGAEFSAMSADQVESSLVLLGMAGLMDPPRMEVREAVLSCQQAGIMPVMITGDHPATACAIAEQVGIAAAGAAVLTGAELASMSAAQLAEQAQSIRVYARVSPAQKLDIVTALQSKGECVAMTGDGVNDAPALQRADIGVAMGLNGTDVARGAADLVLLDDNFATIIAAVREGRHIFDNVRKFVKFIMASNAAEICTVSMAPLLGLPVPLLPIHILWTNLVTDGLPGLALAVEPEEGNVMRRPPRPPRESLFARGLWQHLIWVGLLITVLSIGSQWYEIRNGSDHWQTIVFSVLTLAQMAHVLAVRSERASIWHIGLLSNRSLSGAVLLTIALQLGVIYLPFCQGLFRTRSLTAGELTLVFLLSSIVLVLVEVEKWLVRRGWIYQ